MDVFITQLLAFSSVLLFVLGLDTLLRGRKRVEVGAKPLLFRTFSTEIDVLGKIVGPGVDSAFPMQTRQLARDLVTASLPLAPRDIRGMQAFGCLALGLTGGASLFVFTLDWALGALTGLILAVGGWIWPVLWARGSAKRRQDAMSRSLPFAIDLITTAMQAGQDFGAAVRHYVQEGPQGPLRQEFGVTLREVELGKSRIEALKAMSERMQLEEFRALVVSVMQSSEMGASIAETLKVQAEEIRRARHHRAERQAARAPSLMLLPTALFILPSVFIIIFTPVIMRIMNSGISGYFKR